MLYMKIKGKSLAYLDERGRKKFVLFEKADTINPNTFSSCSNLKYVAIKGLISEIDYQFSLKELNHQ